MSRRIERLPTPQGIGPGQTATVNLPLGPTYHRFDIRMNAQVGGSPKDLTPAEFATHIREVRLLVDGNVKIEASADYLRKRAAFFGFAPEDGVLPVFLSMPWARTTGGEDQTAYGTAGGMSSFTLEIDLADGIEVNSLKIFAEQSAPMPFGAHLRIQKFARSFAVTGVDEIADLRRGVHTLAQIDVTSDNVGEIEVFANNARVHVSDRAIRGQSQKIAKRAKQAGLTHLDFMAQNRVNDTLPMALQDFRVKLTFETQPGSYDIYTTTIEPR